MMVRRPNCLLGLLNLAMFLISILILGCGIWLATKPETDCKNLVEWPIICIGALLIMVSVAGFVGARWNISWLLGVYLCVMFVLILLLLCSQFFFFMVSDKGEGRVVCNRGYKEYRLGDYSHWLQKRVDKAINWRKIKNCIQHDKVCKSLGEHSLKEASEQFYKRNLSPIESGCCKPPTSCAFTYINATFWVSTARSYNISDSDCAKWSNDLGKLCYDCSSCKAGVVAGFKKDLSKVTFINCAAMGALAVVFCIGCSAFF